MRAASDDTTATELRAGGRRAPAERRCVLSGAAGPRDGLVRLVQGPDGLVWPDVAGRLPGRGAWVAADAPALAEAVASGRLAKALARSWKMPPPAVPADLAQRLAALLEARLLDRLGLEHRGGRIAFGAERLEGLARAGRLFLLVHAGDAADDGRRALDQAFRVGGGDPARVLHLPLGRESLSKALGRANVVHLGVTDSGAAARIAADAARWRTFACLNLSGAGAMGPLSGMVDGVLAADGAPAVGRETPRAAGKMRDSPARQERTDTE